MVFGALAARASPLPQLAALCLLTAVGVPLAFIDAAVRRLPDHLTLPLYAGVTGLLLVAAGTARGACQRREDRPSRWIAPHAGVITTRTLARSELSGEAGS